MKSSEETSGINSSLPMNARNFDKTSFRCSVKRFGDVVFALVALVLCSPLFVLMILLVKLSSAGPIFYVQERVGRNYRRFGCIKFRTMYSEADDLLLNLLDKSPELKIEFERDFKLRKDPRITPVGMFMRRSSLDELPQFINIIMGHMSLVGPRPIVEKEIPKYGDFMDTIVSVRPGLTGLWQVSGRNNLSYQRRVQLDFIYATNRSLLLDIRVILRTFGVLLFPRDRGAY
jgi:lipopolysaccharide/colanic/teichoic acid biosynthesis glycosyltransferase